MLRNRKMSEHRIEQNKRRLFLPLALLYLFWIESGVIDPCSATPGYDDSGMIAWVSFPFVAGMLLYWCLHEYNITSTAKYLISALLPTIILSVSALTVTYFLYRMEIELRDTEMWSFIYDAGCYQDAEPQKLLWFAAISIVFYLLMNLFFHTISYLYKQNTRLWNNKQ